MAVLILGESHTSHLGKQKQPFIGLFYFKWQIKTPQPLAVPLGYRRR